MGIPLKVPISASILNPVGKFGLTEKLPLISAGVLVKVIGLMLRSLANVKIFLLGVMVFVIGESFESVTGQPVTD